MYFPGVRCPCTIKQFGEKFKVIFTLPRGAKQESSLGAVNDEKLDNNLSRARSRVFELAACNPWEYFVTLTLDPAKYDRYDLSAWRKDFAQWVRNYNRLNGCRVRYVLIPEQHKDGAWHMHGLMMGFPDGALTKNEHGYLDWLAYSRKFGWLNLGKVRSHEGVSKYITKYISKDLNARKNELGAHLFYASQGLQCALEVWNGSASPASVTVPEDADRYENEYCAVFWLTAEQAGELMERMEETIIDEIRATMRGSWIHDYPLGKRVCPASEQCLVSASDKPRFAGTDHCSGACAAVGGSH